MFSRAAMEVIETKIELIIIIKNMIESVRFKMAMLMMMMKWSKHPAKRSSEISQAS